MAKRTTSTTRKVRLRPQNPFDLIRLLARSQSDPRKAVAELVQNSLDAGAKRIEIEWFNEKGRRALRIWDDGEGVFPELDRADALRRIAKTIGHSHKRDLSPVQRREQMILGQYGIGLIGFWSVGEVLEMKSRVGGGKASVLRLREDRASGEVFVSRSRRLEDTETYTEITIRGVHEGAHSKIRPPRLQAFLATELRGQLLERDAVVRIRDRVARGRARKEFVVEPRPYLGVPLEEWRELEVPGFESARLELYLVPAEAERRGVVVLSCGGTVVLDDIAEIDGADQLRAPWCNGSFEGVIDFPELYVSPGSRRGFAHDEPVAAFLVALEGLEAELVRRVEAESVRREELRRENVTREIRRAFRFVAQELPEYDFFAVRSAADADAGAGAGADADADTGGDGGRSGSGREAETDEDGTDLEANARGEGSVDENGVLLPTPRRDSTVDTTPADPEPEEHLFPPGPLERLEASPKSLRLPHGASRTVRVRPVDADGRNVAGEVTITWRLEGPGELVVDGKSARYTAPEGLDRAEGDGQTVRIHAAAIDPDSRPGSSVEVAIDVRIQRPSERARPAPGIPDPQLVRAPGESWRSRMRDDRWEINEAHRDYLACADVDARRLKYFIHLFAKEVVLRNFGRPGDQENLERMVEVLTYLGRKRERGS